MKIIKILLLTLTLLLVTACGDRVQFKAQEPLENATLVYIYISVDVSSDESSNESDYNIRINNKRTMQRVKEGEYVVFNLKPQPVTISATKRQINEQALNLDLKAGQIYYLKIKDNLSGDAFEFIEVENSLGLKEIVKTGLAGSTAVEGDNILTELLNPKKTESVEVKTTVVPAAPAAQSISTTDEIQKAYNMKEKGIISEEEFKALKTNILSK